jgi:tRNA A-37 threonylcarbamoyl transferase component Bud32
VGGDLAMIGIKCNANNMAPTASADLRLGTMVAAYRVEAVAGRGGMSVVYRARDERLGRDVALKLLAPELTDDEQFRKRFLRESQIAASLHHPNIVPVYAAGEAEGLLYLAMRFVEGADLRALLRRESTLEPARALALLGQVASALDTAHSHGLVHRDVKPANILLDGASLDETAYLADFGLTKTDASRAGATATGQLVGTLDYVAPEQIRGQTLDGRADVYSLACVLYECLTGRPPFAHASDVAVLYAHLHDAPPPASELRPGLPRAIDVSLARALAKQPDERPSSAGELVADAGETLAVVGTLPSAPPKRWHRRLGHRPAPAASRAHRWRLPVVGAALLVVAAVGIGAGLHTRADATVKVIPNSVAVIDPGSNELVGDILVGREPAFVAAAGEHVWVGNRRDRNLMKIDRQRPWRPITIALDAPPAALIAGPNAAWVVTAGSRIKLARFDPRYVDAPTGNVPIMTGLSTTKTGAGIWGGGLDRTPLAFGNATIWTLGGLEGSLIKRDPTTLAPRGKVVIGDFATAIAVASDDVWVTTKVSGLLRINPDTKSIVDTFTTPLLPVDVAVGAHAVWIASEGDDVVARIDPTMPSSQTSIPVGDGPTAIAFGFGSVWVACKGDGTVWRIDPTTTPLKVVKHWKLGASPEDIAAGAGAVWIAVYSELEP